MVILIRMNSHLKTNTMMWPFQLPQIILLQCNQSQCTMVKLKNGVKGRQLLQIISPSILIMEFQNFAHSSLKSPITQINTNMENKHLKKLEIHQKNCWGCLLKSRLVSKKSSFKDNFLNKRAILSKDPQIAKKKWGQSLKNTNSQIFSQDFFNVDNFY